MKIMSILLDLARVASAAIDRAANAFLPNTPSHSTHVSLRSLVDQVEASIPDLTAQNIDQEIKENFSNLRYVRVKREQSEAQQDKAAVREMIGSMYQDVLDVLDSTSEGWRSKLLTHMKKVRRNILKHLEHSFYLT